MNRSEYHWHALKVDESFVIKNPYPNQYIAVHTSARAKGVRVRTRQRKGEGVLVVRRVA